MCQLHDCILVVGDVKHCGFVKYLSLPLIIGVTGKGQKCRKIHGSTMSFFTFILSHCHAMKETVRSISPKFLEQSVFPLDFFVAVMLRVGNLAKLGGIFF